MVISNALADLPIPVELSDDGIARFSVDMAVLGHTDASDSSGRIGPKDTQNYFGIDTRGDSFYYEGLLYPGGTIPDPTVPTKLSVAPQAPSKLNNEVVWDFTKAEPIGTLMSRGWILINGSREPYADTKGTIVDNTRTVPHLLSTHTVYLGNFTPDQLTPPSLITNGMENGNDPDLELMMRSITGGTGPFRFGNGQVQQQRIGRNTTALATFSDFAEVYAPNYRFHFAVRL